MSIYNETTEESYSRGYNSGIAHYERTLQGAGGMTPRSGHRYDSPNHNAWSFGYAEGWSKAKTEAQHAQAVYETATATH